MFASKSIQAFLLAVALGAPVIGLAQSIVVSSDDRRFAVGQFVKAGQTVKPATGKSVSLLGDRLVAVAGPNSATVAPTDRLDTLAGLAQDIKRLEAQISAERVVRGGAAVRPGSLWEVDVAAPGAHCIEKNSPPRLWRSDASVEVELQVTDLSRNKDYFFDWPAEKNTMNWPLPDGLAAGGEYLVVLGPVVQTELSLRAVDDGSDLDLFNAFVAQECLAQIYRVILGDVVSFRNE